MTEKRYEIFVCLNEGIMGAFESQVIDDGTPQNQIYIEYTPFNGFFGKPVRMKNPVSKDNIFTVMPHNDGVKGKPHIYYVHYDPSRPAVFKDALATFNIQSLKIIQNENKQLKNEIGNLRSRMKGLSTGASSAVAEFKKIQSGNKGGDSSDQQTKQPFGNTNLGKYNFGRQ